MMQYASLGVRATVRKATNALRHGGHNGPGNPTSKSLTVVNNVHNALQSAHAHTLALSKPSHQLFSTSKSFLQRFFAHLTAPGLRAPTYATSGQGYGARSLHGTAIRLGPIQQGLSLSIRQSLQQHALRRQANMFLPRGPAPVRPRLGGVAEVGFGVARNFSSARPIFEQLAHNIPIATRALYEVDWDIKSAKAHKKMHFTIAQDTKRPRRKHATSLKPRVHVQSPPENAMSDASLDEIERYFPTEAIAPVMTYLLVPLAPTPTSRQPLPRDIGTNDRARGPALLPSMGDLGAFHASHSLHALRVSTLFTRLDQANVWEQGVKCTAYSQGPHTHSAFSNDADANEGACTVLKLEFEGWTYDEVRAVIGESGSGWCVMEEVHRRVVDAGDDDGSDTDSLASSALALDQDGAFDDLRWGGGAIDPSQSLVLPTIDLFTAPEPAEPVRLFGSNAYIPRGMEHDPWQDELNAQLSPSKSFSYSDLSDTDFGVQSL